MRTYTVYYLTSRGEFAVFYVRARNVRDAGKMAVNVMYQPCDYAEFLGIETGKRTL